MFPISFCQIKFSAAGQPGAEIFSERSGCENFTVIKIYDAPSVERHSLFLLSRPQALKCPVLRVGQAGSHRAFFNNLFATQKVSPGRCDSTGGPGILPYSKSMLSDKPNSQAGFN